MAAGIAAAPAIVSGLGSFFGQRSANKANRKEAKKNRKFQERMRNTSWQAAVEDMRAAGLNPALAYSQGGAASPGGSVAQSQKSELGEGVGSALEVKMAQEQFKLLEAQRENVQTQSRKTDTETQILGIERYMSQGRMSYYFNGNGTPKPAFLELLTSQHGGSVASGARDVSELNLSRLREPEMRAMADMFDRIGEGGKGMQTFLPMMLKILMGGRR